MNDKESTENYNSELERKPTLQEIDELAAELCKEYQNYPFYRWYCRVINVLGIKRVNTIRSMYKDTRQAKHLFSRRASEEMQAKLGQEKLQKIKASYVKKDSKASN